MTPGSGYGDVSRGSAGRSPRSPPGKLAVVALDSDKVDEALGAGGRQEDAQLAHPDPRPTWPEPRLGISTTARSVWPAGNADAQLPGRRQTMPVVPADRI